MTLRHASTAGRAVSASNVQRARSPATSQAPTTTAAARCPRSMTKCPLLIPANAGPCAPAAQWCIIMWESGAEGIAAIWLAEPHMVVVAGTADRPSSCSAACNNACPPATNATARAGLVDALANGAARTTVSRYKGIRTEVPGVAPPAAAWPASPLANSTDGSVSTRTWRSTASLVISPVHPRTPANLAARRTTHGVLTELETTCCGVGGRSPWPP